MTIKAAKYSETLAFTAIRERQQEEGVDTLSVVVGIFDAESMIGEASAVLRDRLTLAPVVAAACDKRGEQAKVARSLIAAEKAKGHAVSREAAAQSVSRMVKVGRVLAAHPTMDPLEAYSLTNRATGEQVEKAIGEKDAEKAAAALARKPKVAGSGKAPKAKTPDSVRENTHNTLASAIEYILTNATEEQARAFYNTLASDLKPLAAALTGGAHTWADVVAATADAAADADEEQEEEAV